MKPSCAPNPLRFIAALAALGLASAPAQTTVFSDNFDGSGDLDGTTPGVTTGGATWVAADNFKADGSFASTTGGSATLAFAPADGLVYTLDASITGITAAMGDINWIALGFANGQSMTAGSNNRFVNGNDVEGRAWMLARGDNSTNPNATHTLGTTDPAEWVGALANANGGDLELRIVLDTTGGTGNWTATWYAKRPADGSYAEVGSTTTLTSEDIDSVGFAVSNAGVSGTIATFSLTAVPASFSDNFDGDAATDLNGTTPDVTAGGAAWVAASNFKADGSFASATGGSATLAFTPADGFVYTLDASLAGITAAIGDINWIALGFANGQSADGGISYRFVNGNDVEGRAWMLARGDNSSNPNVAHTIGSADPSPWTGALANANGGDLDMRIVLDTTGGTGNWTATWHAKRPADGSYTEVRSTTTLTSEDIDSVGFAVSNTGVSGTIESFSLTSVPGVPDIIDITLDGSGDVVLTLDGSADGLQAQQSDDLAGFSDVDSTAAGNTLTIDSADVDPNGDGADFYRVRN